MSDVTTANSLTPTAKSWLSRRSKATLAVMSMIGVYWLTLFYATHTKLPPNLLPGNSDKFVHFAAYALLAVLLMSLRTIQGPYSWLSILVRWLVVAGYGILDELTQLL